MPRTPLVPASYVLLLREGDAGTEVLLHLRRGTGYRDGHWASLAGHVEAGESALQAAVREVREEAGVEVHPSDCLPLTAVHRLFPGGRPSEQRVDFFWTTRRWTGEPRVAEPEKNAGLGWFPLTGLPTPLQPQEAHVLALLAAGTPVPAILVAGATDRPR